MGHAMLQRLDLPHHWVDPDMEIQSKGLNFNFGYCGWLRVKVKVWSNALKLCSKIKEAALSASRACSLSLFSLSLSFRGLGDAVARGILVRHRVHVHAQLLGESLFAWLGLGLLPLVGLFVHKFLSKACFC